MTRMMKPQILLLINKLEVILFSQQKIVLVMLTTPYRVDPKPQCKLIKHCM